MKRRSHSYPKVKSLVVVEWTMPCADRKAVKQHGTFCLIAGRYRAPKMGRNAFFVVYQEMAQTRLDQNGQLPLRR